MPRSMWVLIACAAILVALLFVVDPLGLFEDASPGAGGGADFEMVDGAEPGLEGRGTGTALEGATTHEGEPVGVVDLAQGPGLLRGTVLGEGRPLALARVRAVLPPPSHGLGVRTRPDGTYEIRGLPLGQHELRMTADAYVGQTVVAPLLAAPRETEPPTAVNEVEADVDPVDLARRSESTNAIVVKVLDGFGRPLPGANVLATTLQWDLHLSIGPELAGVKEARFKAGRTDENGICRLEELEPDRYDVAITRKGYITEAVERVQVAENRTRHLGVRLTEGQSIRGKVLTADGRGVDRVYVGGFHLPSFHSAMAVFTDANGDFVLDGLRKGNYTLMAYHDDFGQCQSQARSPSQGVKLKLGGTGTIRLKVQWADGSPVTQATVRPFAVQMGFGYVYSMVEELDDPSGSVELKLPNGNYAVRVQTPEGFLSSDVKADVEVGETREITVIVPKTGVVRGVVVDEQGRHIPGVEIYVRRGGFPPHKSREQYARSNADGEFEVAGLALEPVKLRVSHAAYADTELEAEARPPDEAKELTVTMRAGAVVSGHVRDREGQPIAGRQVSLFENWFEPIVTQTDGDGYYEIRGVAEGTWQLKEGPFENAAPGITKTGIAVPAGGTVTVDFELETSTGTVTGLVQMGGKPVAGATVTIFPSTGMGAMVSAMTEEDGRFEAPGVSVGSYRVYVTTKDNLTASARGSFEGESKTSDVTIEMGTSGVRGRIVRTDGSPLSGAWLTIETADAEDGWDAAKGWKNTSGDGTFSFLGLSPGTYRMRVSHPEYAQLLTEPFAIPKEGVIDLKDLKLKAGAVLSGRVTDDEGKPVEDATVSLIDEDGRPVFLFSFSTTGSDGRYQVQGLELGRYTVTIEAKGYSPFKAPLTLEAGGATIDGTLTRGGAIEITVTDDAGYAIEGAQVSLYDAAGRRVAKTLSLANLFEGGASYTSSSGIARIRDLAPGTYKVSATRAGYSADGAAVTLTVQPGGTSKATIALTKQ